MLKGLAELMEQLLDLPVRIGAAEAFTGSALEGIPQLKGAEFATAIGLALYGERRRKMHDFHESSNSGLKKLVAKFRSFL